MFMQSGIPILYSGDEVGQVNDYTYKEDPNKAEDSRYIHRGKFHWETTELLDDQTTVPGKMFTRLKELEEIRQNHKAFVSNADCWTLETGNNSILAIGRYFDGEKILGIFNFSEMEQTISLHENNEVYTDLLSGEERLLEDLNLAGHGFFYLLKK